MSIKKRQLVIYVILVTTIISYWVVRCKITRTPVIEPEVSLYLHREGRVLSMPLEKYLVGVVLAEMPASFHPEALKAQAVCARTYTLGKMYQHPSHPEKAALCDDPTHCQAYRLPNDSERETAAVTRAVNMTRGEVLSYQGELAHTLYHSSCGGKTASAEEVWGQRLPYLVSVDCPCPAHSPHRRAVRSVDQAEVVRVFAIKPGVESVPVKVLSRTESGRAQKLQVGGRVIDANSFRRHLSLPSTVLTVQQGSGKVIITCSGNGHGVGLCQYGADALASGGYDYQSVLMHYYRDTDLYRLHY